MSLKEKLAYGAGDLGNGFMFDLGQIYLLKFYTDVLGISAAYAGLVFLVSKLFDAFVDSGVGTWVDSRRNIGKRGKFRPFILFGTLPLAITTLISFLSPDLSYTGKVVWAFVTYMLFNATYSIVNIPYGSLAASMTKNPVDRASLASFRSLGSQAALFLTGIAVVLGLTGSIIFEVLNYFIFGDQVATFLTFHALGYFFFMIPNTVIWALIADIVEYGEWMTGKEQKV